MNGKHSQCRLRKKKIADIYENVTIIRKDSLNKEILISFLNTEIIALHNRLVQMGLVPPPNLIDPPETDPILLQGPEAVLSPPPTEAS